MNWNLNSGQKLRTGASLVVVFVLVLATNLVDKNHLKTVRGSLTTVYEDRLVAKSYIYNISRQVQIKQRLGQGDDVNQLGRLYRQADDSIDVLIDSFASTSLIYQEAKRFKSLQIHLKELREYEANVLEKMNDDQEKLTTEFSEKPYSEVLKDLDRLSQIQLNEGRREVLNTNKMISSSDLIAKIEIAFLIVIGFIFQLIIFIKIPK